MATLTSNSIASTYTMLLKMDSTGVTSSLQKVEDGDATDSALSISTIAAALDATDKFYLDGGTHTYIYESADDVLDFYVGAANMLKLTESTTDTVLITGDLTVGVDGTGHDVKFFGDTSGAFALYDQSEDTLEIRGATADAAGSSGKLKLTTAQVSVEDGDILGRIDFASPLETQGSDAILSGAAIWAEAVSLKKVTSCPVPSTPTVKSPVTNTVSVLDSVSLIIFAPPTNISNTSAPDSWMYVSAPPSK